LTARQQAKKERNKQHIKTLKHKAKKRARRDG
jgi:GTP-binding protein